ncbi:RagB/SusD family nutrient uptake outer membrane protein [uncultured Bacteroides sp.]|uniref:RagB/SusD family nutrient uptake outer membrane protein n=1 Tax=uncultured Bacteroides sp. TaxID=162156 RepID=UPI0025D221BD|nr:RagB/SusD family nutrient uptake outer membrane protein [uncultured Bacteroides sp.]
MKKYIFALFSAAALMFASCDDVLDRPQLNNPQDDNYWRNETDLRLFGNGFYTNYFVGYNSSWGTAYAPLRGYNFSDDVATTGKQSSFENAIPSSRGGSAEEVAWLGSAFAGSSWNFAWVRKANLFLDRIETVAKPKITEDTYKHWSAVARFFRGFEYCRLVCVFGDVPYYDKVFSESDEKEMFKNRSPRAEVMDKVYSDFEYALQNLRLDDGAQYLNRYIAAGFISRLMLFEGTWQKYHNGDQALAKKYLEMARDAADLIIASGKWEISSEFRGLFGAQDLKGHKEVLMYRHYDAALSVTHHVASYSNGQESQSPASNLALAKSFLCNDGKPYLASDVEDADVLDIAHMIKTRDPRFEATFANKAKIESATLLYATKFIDRVGPSLADPSSVAIYASMTNTNDYPVMRYSEVLLNWLEAKAELALSYGGEKVTQGDIDISVNKLRSRPLDKPAVDNGVEQTAPMKLADITADFDPARDKGSVKVTGDYEVDPLIWEIRRERRMEFVFEHSRILDLKRWKKLHYMDNATYPDTKLGLWVNIKEEVPSYLDKNKDGTWPKRQVMKEDGTIITYDGTNGDALVGFYLPLNASNRDGFTERSYLAPIGRAQINQYKEKGYTLSQTKGWEE